MNFTFGFLDCEYTHIFPFLEKKLYFMHLHAQFGVGKSLKAQIIANAAH